MKGNYTLILDGWSDKKKLSYMAVIIRYMDKNEKI